MGTGGDRDIPQCRQHSEYLDNLHIQLQLLNTTLFNNITLLKRHAPTAPEQSSNQFTISIILALVGIFGVIGNIMNVAILTRRRLVLSLDRLERSSNMGLFALAISDLAICVVIIPHGFFMETHVLTAEDHLFVLYYKVYGVGLINLFIMVSMWQVVLMTLHRFLIVVKPKYHHHMAKKRNTLIAIMIVYVVSMLLTSPHVLYVCIMRCYHFSYDYQYYELGPLFEVDVAETLQFYIRWIWPVFAVFIPACLLVVCNVKLLIDLIYTYRHRFNCSSSINITAKIHKESTQTGSDSSRFHDEICTEKLQQKKVRYTHLQTTSIVVTLTLVLIIMVILFCIAPVEILRYVNPYRLWGTETGHIIGLVGNLLQSIGFASNFVLYCVVNSRFRQTFKDMFRWQKTKASHSLIVGNRPFAHQIQHHEEMLQELPTSEPVKTTMLMNTLNTLKAYFSGNTV